MKKSLLLAAAAIFAATPAFADWYIVGSDVNGASWDNGAADAKFTETGAGVFEWSGTTLGSEFKITDGTWDTAAVGTNGSELTLGTPYNYALEVNSGNIKIADLRGVLNNPKVTLNTTAGTVTVTGEPGEGPDPSNVTFYIIGSNVNGHEWALQQEDCKFTSMGNGIYRWTGEKLGAGFKINDGTWGDTWNIGGTPNAEMRMNVPLYYVTGGSSANIGFDGFTLITDPVVELNINEETITIVGGTTSGKANWYIAGLNGDFVLDSTTIFTETDEDGVYERLGFEITETAGAFKLATDGWAKELGTNSPEDVYIDPTNMEIELDDVVGEGGNINYELEAGFYDILFDLNEYTLEFRSSDNGVAAIIDLNNGKIEYFNLQGQKVANPDNGIFIKVVGGKASKVVM